VAGERERTHHDYGQHELTPGLGPMNPLADGGRETNSSLGMVGGCNRCHLPAKLLRLLMGLLPGRQGILASMVATPLTINWDMPNLRALAPGTDLYRITV
jgi:hypothetical protein